MWWICKPIWIKSNMWEWLLFSLHILFGEKNSIIVYKKGFFLLLQSWCENIAIILFWVSLHTLFLIQLQYSVEHQKFEFESKGFVPNPSFFKTTGMFEGGGGIPFLIPLQSVKYEWIMGKLLIIEAPLSLIIFQMFSFLKKTAYY